MLPSPPRTAMGERMWVCITLGIPLAIVSGIVWAMKQRGYQDGR